MKKFQKNAPTQPRTKVTIINLQSIVNGRRYGINKANKYLKRNVYKCLSLRAVGQPYIIEQEAQWGN